MKLKKISISLRYFLTIILACIFFTSIILLYQIRVQYSQEVTARDEVLQMIESSYLRPLTSAVFFFDDNQLQLLAEGISLLPFVKTVEIFEKRQNEDYLLFSLGNYWVNSSSDIKSYPLIYDYEGVKREIGSLVISTCLIRVRKSLLDQLRRTLVTNLILIFSFVFIILFVTHKMIFRHLRVIANFVLKIGSTNLLDKELRLSRSKKSISCNDELDEITNAINKMLASLGKQFNDKEKLIQELYHRTNNNMQLIQALLDYRATLEPDLSISDFVEKISSQIMAMSYAHQELFRNNNLSRIDLGEYLKSLVKHVVKQNNSFSKEWMLKFDIEPVSILIDSAIPLGIAINEIVSRSMKPELQVNIPENQIKELKISCAITDKGDTEVTISNNLVDKHHKNETQRKPDSMQDLVKVLVEEQLGGKISLDYNNGTTCKINFTDDRYRERINYEK